MSFSQRDTDKQIVIGSTAESDRPKSNLREPTPEAFAAAERLLRAKGLPVLNLEMALDGEDNQVFLSVKHVVRLPGSWVYDHRREAANAAEARALGVKVPVCVAVGDDWSIWERVPGTNAWRSGVKTQAFWRGLFRDLSRLHALPAPTDAPRPNLVSWHAQVGRLKGLAESEVRILELAMEEPIPPNRLAYAHGDLHEGNMMVAPDGTYAGLIDWASGGWWPPELDYALLPPVGLREAIDAPFEPLDWSLVATLRVGMMVKAHLAGHVPLRDVQTSLGFWQLMRY